MVEENQIAEPQGDAVTGNDTEGIEEQEQAGENANDVEQTTGKSTGNSTG